MNSNAAYIKTSLLVFLVSGCIAPHQGQTDPDVAWPVSINDRVWAFGQLESATVGKTIFEKSALAAWGCAAEPRMELGLIRAIEWLSLVQCGIPSQHQADSWFAEANSNVDALSDRYYEERRTAANDVGALTAAVDSLGYNSRGQVEIVSFFMFWTAELAGRFPDADESFSDWNATASEPPAPSPSIMSALESIARIQLESQRLTALAGITGNALSSTKMCVPESGLTDRVHVEIGQMLTTVRSQPQSGYDNTWIQTRELEAAYGHAIFAKNLTWWPLSANAQKNSEIHWHTIQNLDQNPLPSVADALDSLGSVLRNQSTIFLEYHSVRSAEYLIPVPEGTERAAIWRAHTIQDILPGGPFTCEETTS